jgi:hypothetical protein
MAATASAGDWFTSDLTDLLPVQESINTVIIPNMTNIYFIMDYFFSFAATKIDQFSETELLFYLKSTSPLLKIK